MRVEMVDVEGQLLRECADKRMKQADVALTYAFALRQHGEVDWPKVNGAIIERWSMAGLQRVKRMAWGYMPDGARPAAAEPTTTKPGTEGAPNQEAP